MDSGALGNGCNTISPDIFTFLGYSRRSDDSTFKIQFYPNGECTNLLNEVFYELPLHVIFEHLHLPPPPPKVPFQGLQVVDNDFLKLCVYEKNDLWGLGLASNSVRSRHRILPLTLHTTKYVYSSKINDIAQDTLDI